MNKILAILYFPILFPITLYIIFKYHDEIVDIMRKQGYENAKRYFESERRFRHGVNQE